MPPFEIRGNNLMLYTTVEHIEKEGISIMAVMDSKLQMIFHKDKLAHADLVAKLQSADETMLKTYEEVLIPRIETPVFSTNIVTDMVKNQLK